MPKPYIIKRVESKISLIHVLTATDETSQVWAVLKLFLHLLRKKKERRKMNSSPLDLSASPQVKSERGAAAGDSLFRRFDDFLPKSKSATRRERDSEDAKSKLEFNFIGGQTLQEAPLPLVLSASGLTL